MQRDRVGLLPDLHTPQLVQLDLANITGPHAPFCVAGQSELLHGHHSVHDVVQRHHIGELGDEDEMRVQIAGELADILLEAMLRFADEVSSII